jgi:hypothetical protein
MKVLDAIISTEADSKLEACAQGKCRAKVQPAMQMRAECGAMEKSLSGDQHTE